MVRTQRATPNAATPARRFSTAFAALVREIFNPFAESAPTAPPVDPPTALVLLAAVRRELSGTAVNLAPPSPITASPTLILNGYNVVPSSTENVTGFYGRFTNPPALAGVVQGEQEFDVVDPITGIAVGTFEALESNTNSLIFGGTYQQLLITEDLAGTVGTGAGATPPVGSVIAVIDYGRFGTFYSSMPSPSGAVISFKIVTPFGDIPLPLTYDAAAGLADHSADNRPVQLTDDFYIAPQSPSAENLTAITGLTPFFIAVQGDQVFDVYQTGTNASVGSFRGLFTTTSDIALNTSEAILVTEVLAGTEGTDAGDTPPVGSVYNVIYHDQLGVGTFYSAIPSPSGTVITFKLVTPLGDVPLRSDFDATTPPLVESLSVPDGYTFVPASTLQPTGINGLPPREVQIQGNQQFDVYDSAGSQIGSFDANVTNQWDNRDIYSGAVRVTDVTESTAAGNVPPVGSVFNFIYFGGSGFGAFYSVVPSPSGDVKSFKLLTPVGAIPIPTPLYPVAGVPRFGSI